VLYYNCFADRERSHPIRDSRVSPSRQSVSPHTHLKHEGTNSVPVQWQDRLLHRRQAPILKTGIGVQERDLKNLTKNHTQIID
jgi:hypothetical protein